MSEDEVKELIKKAMFDMLRDLELNVWKRSTYFPDPLAQAVLRAVSDEIEDASNRLLGTMKNDL